VSINQKLCNGACRIKKRKMTSNNILSEEEIPKHPLFHRTERQNIQSILNTGIRKNQHAKEPDEEFFRTVVQELNLSCPVNRNTSTFFYPNRDRLVSVDPIIVVDATELSNDIFVASMDKYDEIISHTPRNYNKFTKEDTVPIEKVKQYVDSIEKVSPVDIQTVAMKKSYPEVLVSGRIPASNIKGVLR